MKKKHTPLIAQYFEIRQHYPDALLFFQVGDFYELFFEDAIKASEFLAITLTKRGKADGKDIPLCGVPVHALTHYMVKLVKGGHTVAICDQVSKPMPGTVVKRAVTKVYTPGTLTDTQLLDEKTASYLCALACDDEGYSVVFTELLTMQLFATHIPHGQLRLLEAEIGRFCPDEIALDQDDYKTFSFLQKSGYVISVLRDKSNNADEWVAHISEEAKTSAGLHVLYHYLYRMQPDAFKHFSSVAYYEPASYVHIDPATSHNLEIIKNQQGGSSHTLFSVVDRACTSMGSRLLKKWLMRPLHDQHRIRRRHDAVQALAADITLMQSLKGVLRSIADLERIVGRIALHRASIADYKTLAATLRMLPELQEILAGIQQVDVIATILHRLPDYSQLVALLNDALNDDEHHPGSIKKGFDEQLDRLRDLALNGQQAIANLAQKEAEAHDIASLKILYTNAAGYFIEVTKANVAKVPEHYRQVATMVNRNRYITDELKALEHDVSHAREESEAREKELFDLFAARVYEWVATLRRSASALAQIDALYALSDLAYTHAYVRPTFSHDEGFQIVGGRHPVVEQSLKGGFIANDAYLAHPSRLWIITGPNMGGKSTYLRQVALIALLAQCGSFVPATSACLPIVDRIFTRIGAGDNVAQGKSTFLVEMEETATICNQATQKSLVILDEVGRGTSTDDGRALAQAIIEYLVSEVGCYTLFATHYHELTQLAATSGDIANYNLACIKRGETLHFLHQLAPGVATASFGIDVAKLAHLPLPVIERARYLITHNTSDTSRETNASLFTTPTPAPAQRPEDKAQRKAIEELKALDINDLSPRAAFDKLWNLQKLLTS
mgnify:CR=1 FL=1